MTGEPQSSSGEVVVVTGASSGVGRAIAIAAAAQGASTVIVNYARDLTGANETARSVREQGARVEIVQGDISQDEDCRRIAEAAKAFGRVDALFNNAGITMFADQRNLDAVSSDDFMRLFAVNVIGPYQVTRALQDLLTRATAPAIVNTSSISGLTGLGSSTPYAASKGALVTMTLSLARALAPIRVNAICPGFIDTPWAVKGLGAELAEKARRNAASASPLARYATAEDVARAALFLASPAAAHMTGEIVRLDGGAHLVSG